MSLGHVEPVLLELVEQVSGQGSQSQRAGIGLRRAEERSLQEAQSTQNLIDASWRERTDPFAQLLLFDGIDLGDDNDALLGQEKLPAGSNRCRPGESSVRSAPAQGTGACWSAQ